MFQFFKYAATVTLVFAATAFGACSTDFDCQLNGACNAASKKCECDTAWSGPQCGVLDVDQATVAYGHGAATSPLISAWGGGPPVLGDDGQYHLFVSELAAHCGMATWSRMSFLSHTVAASPVGPFTRVAGAAGTVAGTFAHNAFYIFAGGLHLVYHIGDAANPESCNPYFPCTNGTTPGGQGFTPPPGWPSGTCPPSNGGVNVHFSESLNGPWTNFGKVTLGPGGPASLSNPAPLVLQNGTVLLMGRTKDSAVSSSVRPIAAHNIFLFRAPAWNSTYQFLPGTGPNGSVGVGNGLEFTEDPVLWQGRRGFHALFHSQGNLTHGWSSDAFNWGWSPDSAGAAMFDPSGSLVIDHERPRVVLDAMGDLTLVFIGSKSQDNSGDASRLLVFKVAQAQASPTKVGI